MTDLLSRIERGEPVEAQEVFDFAVSKVIEQGVPALSAGRFCAYRGELGRKCAFGHLIPDSLYEIRLEGVSAHSILSDIGGLGYSSRLAASLGRHSDLVVGLQSAHDGRAASENFVAKFRYDAKVIAERHDLTFNF